MGTRLSEKTRTIRMTMASIVTTAPPFGASSLGHNLPTVFVTPIIPSPMMIKVRSDSLSFRCVSLKLSILQIDEIVTTKIASIGKTTHQTIERVLIFIVRKPRYICRG
jgi:hypothetical protein